MLEGRYSCHVKDSMKSGERAGARNSRRSVLERSRICFPMVRTIHGFLGPFFKSKFLARAKFGVVGG